MKALNDPFPERREKEEKTMKSKLFSITLALAMTSGLLASLPAAAQSGNEIHDHIEFALHDGGWPKDDCNFGHPGCCNGISTFWEPRSTTAWAAVQAAKYGYCSEAVAMILATQCHNPEALWVLANNPGAVCNELVQH